MPTFEEKVANTATATRTHYQKNDAAQGVIKEKHDPSKSKTKPGDEHDHAEKATAKKPAKDTAQKQSDYYGPDGCYLYSSKAYDNKVFIVAAAPAFDESLAGSGVMNQREIPGLDADKFRVVANIIKQEGVTNNPGEYLNIANAGNNEAKARGLSLYDLLMTGYSSVKNKTPLHNSDTSDAARFARAALLCVLQGYSDTSGGATFWDGTDFLAWGLQSPDGTPQNKFTEYNQVEISKNIFDAYLDSNRQKYGPNVTFGKVAYPLPAKVFSDPGNWQNGMFIYKTGASSKYKLVATATGGLSIFWKKVLNINVNGKN